MWIIRREGDAHVRERQIDRLVYELDAPSDRCGLTEEEVALVERLDMPPSNITLA